MQMIVICDKEYKACSGGKDIKDRAVGSGAFAEYTRISNRLYSLGGQPNKWLVPVIWAQDGRAAESFVPGNMAPWSFYKVNSSNWDGFPNLLFRLHDSHPYVLPTPGPSVVPPPARVIISDAPVA
jgi:hypothetical protein